jgi:hypothetical protein
MPTKQKIRARIVMCVSNSDLNLGTQARGDSQISSLLGAGLYYWPNYVAIQEIPETPMPSRTTHFRYFTRIGADTTLRNSAGRGGGPGSGGETTYHTRTRYSPAPRTPNSYSFVSPGSTCGESFRGPATVSGISTHPKRFLFRHPEGLRP